MEFEEYLRELSDESDRLRVSGLTRLSDLTEQELKRLRGVWPNLNVRRRRRMVQELTDLAEDDVELNFDSVFMVGLADEDSDVRVQSIRGLWEYEKPDLAATLLKLLETDDAPAVRAEAALALGRYVKLAVFGRVRERYFRSIEEGLKRALADDSEAEEVQARALEAIAAHDSAWIRQSIREAYESGRHRLKVSAVYAMGQSCETRWLPLIIRELSNEDAEVRYEAATAAGVIADESAVPHLLTLLNDSDEQVQRATIEALGEIGGDEARQVLLSLADNPSPAVREAAADALATIEFEDDPLAFRHQF